MPAPRPGWTAAAAQALGGLGDAAAVHRVLPLLYKEPRLLNLVARCLLLNAGIFGGSIWTLHRVLLPMAAAVGAKSGAGQLAELVARLAYHAIWLYPAYAISYVANCLWYEEIGRVSHDAAMKTAKQNHRPTAPRSWDAAVAQELYKLVLLGVFFAQITLGGALTPDAFGVRAVAVHVLLSWMYAFYCFDYRWSCEKVALSKRIEMVETRWAYFLGFGTPSVLSACAVSSDALVSAAVCSALFPVFVIAAAAAADVPENERASVRLPIFQFADAQSSLLCRAVLGRPTAPARR